MEAEAAAKPVTGLVSPESCSGKAPPRGPPRASFARVYGVDAFRLKTSASESFRLRHLAGAGIGLHGRRRAATSGAIVTTSTETSVPPVDAMSQLVARNQSMQRRMDYSPDVTGSPRVAHNTHEPKTFDGFVFPTRRRVHLHDDGGNADQSFAPIPLDVEQVTAL
jgi:hypothetical protein